MNQLPNTSSKDKQSKTLFTQDPNIKLILNDNITNYTYNQQTIVLQNQEANIKLGILQKNDDLNNANPFTTNTT